MEILYTEGFSDSLRITFRSIIRRNFVEAVQALVDEGLKRQKFSSMEESESHKFLSGMRFSEIDDEDELKEIATHLKILCSSEVVNEALKKKNQIYLLDSYSFFNHNIEKIMSPGYIPDEQDILRSKIRTSGITEKEFIIDKTNFVFVDVGGQRNERRKWLHCSKDATLVLFVASISEFDQPLYEDSSSDRMKESLKVFADTIENPEFKHIPVILFLNKMDLFREKISSGIDPGCCFSDYKSGCDFNSAKMFIARKFSEIAERNNKEIMYHFTTAVDTKNIESVWKDCQANLAKKCPDR